jgi:hypothetical protein
VPELTAFEFEMAIENLKRHKSTGTDQIPTELIKTGGRTSRPVIHKLINNKAELPEDWKLSITVPIH